MARGSDFAQSGADLELVGIEKRFPGFTAIQHLDLTIPAGQFFALLGPSGCGKTTTLRMVAGLEEPTAGRILIGGTDVTDLKAYKRPVNTVFQSYALFPHMTIIENVAFGLRRRGVRDALAKAKEGLDLVELGHVADRKPAQLSGGQQQRVALARAIVNRPALLLLDEPLGALDLKLRRQMQLELKNIQTEVGLTFLHVTHDQEEAMTMADTIAVMNEGAIEQMGAPEDLYERPKTVFVANFLGQSNLYAGHIREDADGVLGVDVAGSRIQLLRSRSEIHSGAVTVGVRPEKLLLHLEEPSPTPGINVLGPGRITDVSFTGVSTQYIIEIPGLPPTVVFSQNLVFGPVADVGSEVWVTWQAEHTFGLLGAVEEEPKFVSDLSTATIATQTREELQEELGS